MENNKKKETWKSVLGGIILIGMVLFIIVRSALVLVKTTNPVKFTSESDFKFEFGSEPYVDGYVFYGSKEYCELTHSMYLIPTGVEHYFLVFNDDFSNCISVRADKKWVKQFEDGIAISEDGVWIKGIVKRMNYKVSSEAQKTRQLLVAEGVTDAMETNYYIDLLSVRYAIIALVDLIVLLVLACLFWVTAKKSAGGPITAVNDNFIGGKAGLTICVCLLVADVLLLIHVLSMM